MRRDLLPAAYIDELELLHDHVPPMGIDAVRATVEVELGAPYKCTGRALKVRTSRFDRSRTMP
jgi:predicted unusual protein kinase regulating ubiquinone biosynthesis (AarF/ABC1/UbiB family)